MNLIQGDCLEKMQEFPDGAFDLTVTSPPYDDLRTYNDADAWTEEKWKRAIELLFFKTKKGGAVAWNVGDATVDGSESGTSFRQAIHALEVGFNLHDTMIWHKPNFSNPSKTRYHQLFEYVFIWAVGKPKTFNPICDKPNKYLTCVGRNTGRQKDGTMVDRAKNVGREFGMRGNVWLGNTAGQENMCKSLPHPAMMPKWLARDLITSWSNPGDTVLDPFMGSGTTGLMALETERQFVGIERDASYFSIARNRLELVDPMNAENY